MKAYYGEKLASLVGNMTRNGAGEKFLERENIARLVNYLEKPAQGKVMAINGLRRTGKTVMMLQAIEKKSENCAYLLASERDGMDSLENAIENLRRQGISKFFIDEATLLPEFIDEANFLSDMAAGSGCHIVLSGTDSLGFAIAHKNSLYDRDHVIHTTWIPWHEHERLLKTASIDDYISSGGIFSAERRELFKDYALDAIAANIVNTLRHFKNGSRFGILRELHEQGLLLTVINNIVNDSGHRFVMSVARDWKLNDLAMAKADGRGKPEGWLLRRLDLDKVLDNMMEKLGCRRRGLLMNRVEKRHVWEINAYLRLMGIIQPSPVLDLAELVDPACDIFSKISPANLTNPFQGEWRLIQPGLRWAQVEAVTQSLQEEFAVSGRHDPEILDNVFNRIRNRARGAILEDVAATHTARADAGNHVFLLRGPACEIDMVVAKKDGSSFSAYEIKNSSEPKSSHARHLLDKSLIASLEKRFGRLEKRQILYRGENCSRNGCEYRNIGEYLRSLFSGSGPEKQKQKNRPRPA